MKTDFKTILKNKKNCIWAFLFSSLFCVVTATFFDYYYDLNDDMLMKDIVAGIYTGTPSGHNIQMLYPLSFFLSLLYHIGRNIPWYGIFFLLCQYGCLYLLTERFLSFYDKRWKKAVQLVIEAGLLITLFLSDLVFVQYTVTAALLASTAAFLFFTSAPASTLKGFLRNNTISIVLVILAYQMRTELLLMLLPFICVTGVCRWVRETPVFTKLNFQKYFSVFGLILAGMIVSQGVHILAYGSEQWKEFNRFFDNRTELYDFQYIPSYDGNEAFYESIGLTKSEQTLLVNYNFGLDEEINADVLGQVAAYAAELKKGVQPSFTAKLKQAVWELKYRLLYETDRPWNLVAITLYVLVFAAALCNKNWHILWELPFLFAVRSGLWLFILYRGRSPVRITHSLYLMECLILLAILLTECHKQPRKKIVTILSCGSALAMLIICFLYAGAGITKTGQEFARREQVNQAYLSLQEYVKERKDSFYFWDVYSSVAYSEKMLTASPAGLSNLDIMGGWADKSPLTREKYEKFGFSSMQEALLTEDVYIVVKSPELSGYPLLEEWLPAFYADQNYAVKLKKVDSVYAEGQEVFSIYQVQPAS
ncbi:MAG: hypothetical protein ACI4SA_06555 [Lachnospiraceae bacterium]